MFAILTDYTRVLVKDSLLDELKDLLNDLLNLDLEILPIIVFILLFNILIPIAAICLDRSTFDKINK
jgi:hypothetical protein